MKHASMTIQDIIEVLAGADRMGMPLNIPEGSRFLQISDTLAQEIVNSLKCLLDVLKAS